MNHVITWGSLIHFILRWGGWLPLLGGLGCSSIVVMAAGMSDNPEEPGVSGALWSCLFVLLVGISMEIAAFFVRG